MRKKNQRGASLLERKEKRVNTEKEKKKNGEIMSSQEREGGRSSKSLLDEDVTRDSDAEAHDDALNDGGQIAPEGAIGVALGARLGRVGAA
jgi:hypothetical protein